MRVLVLNGSPSGENSITLQTVRFWECFYPKITFEVLHVGQRIRSFEKDFSPARNALEKADLIVFCYPVYTFLVPAQLHRFIELVKEHQVNLEHKFATQISTSKHFYDVTAHRFIKDNCRDFGCRYIEGLSADMEDLLSKKGQKEALSFFRYVLWNMRDSLREQRVNCDEAAPEKTWEIAVVADIDSGSRNLQSMIDHFTALPALSCRVVNIREFHFSGGCLGCFHCASDGTCIYRDGFDTLLREQIQSADAIVYAYRIQDHSMGAQFKLFDDRQFCNGHRTVTMGKPVAYLVEGNLDKEPNLQMLMEARAQVGGNFLAGIVCDGETQNADLERLARRLTYVLKKNYNQPPNFYGVGGMKIFRDLIYQMQGLMREDHRFYKEHGFYDFPQKQAGKIAGMYLVGAMMNRPGISEKLGGKMTEGMMMPYRRLCERVGKRKQKGGTEQ